MKRIVGIAVLTLIALIALVYGGDYAVLRFKIWKGRDAFASVTVDRYYAIDKKSNKIEYVYLDSVNEPCVHALFPHMGDLPCWYLTRHTEDKIEI